VPERLEPPIRTHASLFDGDSGILLLAFLVEPSADLADLLYDRVRENWDNETNELMNGAPGTMIAAKAMLDRTGEDRWAEAWRESAEELWRRRYLDGFWTYAPYGKGIGASHGIGTNTNVLLAGGDPFPEERREALVTGTAKALARTAVVEGGLANRAMAAEDCGELEWREEIRLFERTGDERWLERARRLAVHALGQAERWRAERGRGRCSLWAGDIGAALYAADCLDARTKVPIVDTLRVVEPRL
jgi:hypothetical protein